MADTSHQEQPLHDSEYTSDSSDEFASASEGDDDLPWEPVVIRSPMVSRQSPQLLESNKSTPPPSRANVVSDHALEQQKQQEQQEQQEQQKEYPARVQQQQQQHHVSSTPTRSRSTPKLRERVRQSPVLHSRIVRAYLDPNASSAHQHASPEFVREAWLQEHQETQRDSSEEEEEEANVQDALPNQGGPSLTPLQGYHHSAPVPVTAPAVVAPSSTTPLMTTSAQTDLLEVDDSWGFDDTLNIEEAAQEDQEETSRVVEECTLVPDEELSAHLPSAVPDAHHQESTMNSRIHQDHELDIDDEDAWGGDDQLLDLVEADIHSTLTPRPLIQEELQHVEQDGWNHQQYDHGHKSTQEHGSVDDCEQEHESQQLYQPAVVNANAGEVLHDDQTPFISPEEGLYRGQDAASNLHQSSPYENNSVGDIQPGDTTSVELLGHLDSEAAWHDSEVLERSSALEELHNATVKDILENDTQAEPEAASQGRTHDPFSQGSQSKEEIPMGSDSEEAEASWGFDMDQVIDIEAYPIEEAPLSEMGHHDHMLHSTDNVDHHESRDGEVEQFDAPQSLPEARDTILAQESLQIEHNAIIPEQEQDQNVQGSDDENDSEVREIMQAAQHNPFIGSDDCLQTGQSSVALSSIISDSEYAMDNEDHRTSEHAAESTYSHREEPSLHSAPVVSHLSIMQDAIPEPLESASLIATLEQQEPSNVAQDHSGVASDSEGSDIYGDLSTARSGINASSNRLNEILDDDDYLEHMERGVPMNRSISTPYSDDESPKFIVEDEIVELMERGEPRGLDAAPLELHDDLHDNTDDTSLAVHQIRSPSPAPAIDVELDIPCGTVAHDDRVDAFDPETKTLEELPSAMAAEDAAIHSLEATSPIFTPLNTLDATPCIDASKSTEEPFMAPLARDETHLIEPVDIEASDDQDPANPFSDAAAVDTEDDLWPVTVQPVGTPPLDHSGGIEQDNKDEAEHSVDEKAHQDSWPESSAIESNLDADVQEDDAWAEQDLNIVVERVPQLSLPVHTEIPSLTESDVTKAETLTKSDPDEQPTLETSESTEPSFGIQVSVEEDADEDAWGDDAHHLVDDISSVIQAESGLMPGNTSAQYQVQKDDHITDEFQRHYSPLLPADAPEDQISEPAWNDNRGADIVADIVEEDDAWSCNDEINVSEVPLHTQSDKTDAPLVLEGIEELPEAQEDSLFVETQINDVVPNAQQGSLLDGNIVAEYSSETTELGNVIDDALVEEDAWADQDEHNIAESKSTDVGLSEPEVASESPVQVYGSDQQPDLSTEHASLVHNNVVDNWSEEDAWNDEDIDLMDVSSLVPKQEAGQPAVIDNHEEDHIDSRDAEPTVPVTFKASSSIADPGFQHPIDTALDSDAWIDQELNVDEIDDTQSELTVTGVTLVETAQAPSDTLKTTETEVGSAIHSDLREDLWSDQGLYLTVQNSELSEPAPCTTRIDKDEEYQETRDHEPTDSILEHHEPFAVADDKTLLKFTQSFIDSATELTSAMIGTQFVDDTLLESALDEDAWGDQDINIDSELAENDLASPHFVQPAHGDKDQAQDGGLDVKNEARPSSILRVGSIIHQTTSDQPDYVVEDAWGWDEDEVAVHLEIEKQTPPPSTEETMAMANDTHLGSPVEQDLNEQKASQHEHADAVESITRPLQGTAHSLLPAHGAADTADLLSPLAIHKEGAIPGTDSGEGDEDSTNASQSPWQDVSPASVSKRSEAGMSVGSEFESEYSIQSLDDDEHISSSQAETKTPVETSMSWTSLHTDGWQSDSHGSSGDLHGEDKSDKPASPEGPAHKASQPVLEIQDLPDISGADSWDFDQDDNDDLQSDLMAFKQEQSPVAPRTGSTRDLKTPDMDEHPLFAQQHAVHLTPSAKHTLSPQQASTTGIQSTSPQTPSTPAVAATITNEVEDDSHLPLAIRQQRARLAAKGKPLPPISKYNSAKDTGATADQSLSPRLAAATSPGTAFAAPAKSPLSPMLKATSPITPAASSSPTATAYLSPALQKQRERLEQKRAAAAAAAATPLSAARRLTVTETPKALGSQPHGKPTSPLLPSKTLSSALKSTLGSPTFAKKTVSLVGPSEPLSSSTPPASPSSLVEESTQLSSRRRGSSAAPTPSSPLAEGFVRRSKDGSRPSVKPTTGFAADTAVRTSQSDSYRHGSWLSSSSVQSGWDETFDDDDHQDQAVHDSGSKVPTSIAPKDHKEPPMLSSATSSSFYQQTVPGIDDDDSYRAKTSKPTTTTISTSTPPALTSSYLSSKKADDYDAYGPMARKSGKSKSSMEDSTGSVMADQGNETLIGGSAMSAKTNVSLLSPTSATSMSHRHDHHHGHHSSTTSGGGFFSGGGNSLVGDISTILSEKAAAQGNTSASGSGSYENDNNKKPPTSNLQKSSSWSFGSWVSSAVAVASEKIDKAYETLDPEYSRMKTRGGSSPLTAMGDGSQDPESTSPFKKPGYVVGGSSLALGLASISTGPSTGSSQPQQQQPQQQHHHHASPPASATSSGLGFGSRGGHGDGGAGSAASDSRAQKQQQESHAPEQRMPDWEREQATLPRLTRKNVSGR
ncbi:hypothetical protein BGZ72_003516 [Mortierella alpina]|nr:hypothetical protein BGZ72_003516 [Mortierella alpina]